MACPSWKILRKKQFPRRFASSFLRRLARLQVCFWLGFFPIGQTVFLIQFREKKMKINQLSNKQKLKFFLQPKEAPKLRAFLVCYASLISVLFCLGTVGVFSFCCALAIFASEGFRLFLAPALAKDGDFLFFESQEDKEGQHLLLQKTTLTSAFLKTKNGPTFSVPKYFFLASSFFFL